MEKKLHDKNLFTNWSIIHRAIELDEPRDIHYLQHFHIEPINGCISECKDKNGNIYKIPNYCINDPYFEREIKYDSDNKMEEIYLIVKFYKYGDFERFTINVSNKISGKELKQEYRSKKNLDENIKIRMIISGIEIKDEEYLYQHKVTNDNLINVYII